MQRQRRLSLCWLAATAAVGLTGCDSLRSPPGFNSTDVTGIDWGQGFSLRDPDGRTRTLRDFEGRVVLVFFGFTQCPDVCPTALTRAAEVKRQLGANGERFLAVFVTVDPQRDSPEVLRAYIEAFDPAFVALTGSDDEIAATAQEFRVFYRQVPTGSSFTIDHTASSFVFDPRGRLRLVVPHQLDTNALAADVRRLIAGA